MVPVPEESEEEPQAPSPKAKAKSRASKEEQKGPLLLSAESLCISQPWFGIRKEPPSKAKAKAKARVRTDVVASSNTNTYPSTGKSEEHQPRGGLCWSQSRCCSLNK